MSSQSPKQVLFAQFALVAKTLGHAHRLELLEQLAQGDRTVEVLAQKAGLSVANASQHLQQMRRAGLITSRREGKFVFIGSLTKLSWTFWRRCAALLNAISRKLPTLCVAILKDAMTLSPYRVKNC